MIRVAYHRTLFCSCISIHVSLFRNIGICRWRRIKDRYKFNRKEYQPKELVDWSFQSYKYDISRDEDKTEEPIARWIVKKRQKWLPIEEPDQQIVKDLIINTEQHVLDKQSKGSNDSMELFFKEVFGSIKPPVISALNNYSGISDPSNSWVSC